MATTCWPGRCRGGPGVLLARGHVSGVGFSALKLVDKVLWAEVVCRVLWHLMAMDVLGHGLALAGSGSPLLHLSWATPDVITRVRGCCLAR